MKQLISDEQIRTLVRKRFEQSMSISEAFFASE
jgi:hypothetical protein